MRDLLAMMAYRMLVLFVNYSSAPLPAMDKRLSNVCHPHPFRKTA
jgi:hypothetical protein